MSSCFKNLSLFKFCLKICLNSEHFFIMCSVFLQYNFEVCLYFSILGYLLLVDVKVAFNFFVIMESNLKG